eukprot:343182_1
MLDECKNKLHDEIVLLVNLGIFKQSMHTFLSSSKSTFIYEINAVLSLLEIEPEQQSICIGGGSGAWSTGMGIVNSFANILVIFGADEIALPLKLAAWAIRSTRTIGSGVIAGQNKGII